MDKSISGLSFSLIIGNYFIAPLPIKWHKISVADEANKILQKMTNYLVFTGDFWDNFGYSSFKMFKADIFKNDCSLRQ